MTRQTEAEWDDEDRGQAEGLARYEIEVCPGCNIHPTVVDQLGALTWEDRLCGVCRSGAVHTRSLATQDEEWNKQNPDAKPKVPRPSDGRHSRLRPMSAEEVAERATRGKRS